jgi:hypothetical protein
MEIRIYSFDLDKKKIKLAENQLIPKSIINKLNIFNKEIIDEYFKKQKGRKGVRSLGNEIRYNEIINNQVFVTENNISLKKITGNRKDFLKDFLDSIDQKNHYYLLFDKEFVRQSSIVDKTSTSIKNIEEDLQTLFRHMSLKKDFNFYFIEFFSIKNHIFTCDEEGFKTIKKINNGF